MGKHVIVGAGAVGRGVATELAVAGHEVTIVSRSGRTPGGEGVTPVSADATDVAALTRLATGADVIYNCANPPHYHRWEREWPPLADAILVAACATGADLVTMGNLYVYGPTAGPLRPDTPLAATWSNGRVRIRMWEDALAAHRAGRIRVTEARASDFVGPGSGAVSHLGDRVIPRILAGKKVRAFGAADVPHTWTFVPDVARTLAVLGTDERSWGRAWHVPSNEPLTQREAFASIADAAGVPLPPVGTMSAGVIRALGVAVPLVREFGHALYQFEAPFVIDASETTATFEIEPTPWAECIRATLAAYASTESAPLTLR